MNNQKMRVWWCPQVGICDKHFYIPVETVEEAKKIMDVLAYYDCYQMNQNIKGDYANCGGLEVWDESEREWCDWWYEDNDNYFDDVDEYIEAMSDKSEVLEALKSLEETLVLYRDKRKAGDKVVKGSSKAGVIKYMCPCCGNSVRATKEVMIMCMDCEERMEAVC